MKIVYTKSEKCRGCYACVRECPCKAIKVENNLAEVIPELCVTCGTCVRVCAPKAKLIESGIGVVQNLLEASTAVVAVVSSSFPAAITDLRPGQFVSALKKLGFREVMEDAFGSELVSREYKRLLQQKCEKPIFSSNCPAVVSYIEKYYPQFVDNLAPIVSPMIAMGRLIKQVYNPEAKVVFIGPCAAKKAESRDENVAGVIDAVLTFPELKEMFLMSHIDPQLEKDEKFSGPKPSTARLFAIAGAFLKITGYADDIQHNKIINANGRDHVISLLPEIVRGNVNADFINYFFCNGCIDGPAIDNNLSIFHRRELIAKYSESDSDPIKTGADLQKYSNVDLKREFKNRDVALPVPSNSKIEEILVKIGKSSKVDRFNCGACGYRTCRELAAAVARNQAEITMCWHYLLSELKETQEGLIRSEKLSSLGELAASFAHEINNPLSGVLVYTQLLDKKISANDFNKETALNYLGKMESELTRSTKLIRNLLDFARQSPPTLKETDINEIVKQSLELVVAQCKLKDIKVIRKLSPSLPSLMADPDQLKQVCINLILNSVQAMPAGGTLSLFTEKDEDQIKVEIQDTGCGISAENMNKIFTPFFTTKKEVKGVGLGLAVSYGIVERHRGTITVKSKEGEGTTFSFLIPLRHAE
jgi:signal transduction histidine kinase/iron only hydrogenase large subunit-like protein